MGVVGTPLKNRRAREVHLARNLPGLGGAETLEVRSAAFGDGAAIPVGHGRHRHVFAVFALGAPAAADVNRAQSARPRAVLAAVTGPAPGRGRLTGVYER